MADKNGLKCTKIDNMDVIKSFYLKLPKMKYERRLKPELIDCNNIHPIKCSGSLLGNVIYVI